MRFPFKQLLLMPLIIGLAACEHTSSGFEPSGKIQAPEVWQSHLKTAKLADDFHAIAGQTIYVPIYSHIYHEDPSKMTLLAGTMSIRNTDPKSAIYLTSIAYHGTDGKLVDELCKLPIILEPMATADIVVPRRHTQGGSGANFLVKWVADKKVSPPLTEAVMISAGASRNLSFVSRGIVTENIAGDK